MGFLAPAAFALAALSIPIILLYLLRLRRREALVSSTLLWQQLMRDRQANTPWQRLRRNLLLLLQLLVLALLVLTLARPFLPLPSVVSGSVVVLLDSSASMQATDVAPNRFEAARRLALGLVDGLGPGEVGTIIAVGPQPEVLGGGPGDPATLRRALETAMPSSGSADWEAAFALAAALAAGTPEAQFVIVSDGAAAGTLPALPGPARFVRVGERADNLAIVALAVREGRGGPQAFVRVANSGRHSAEVAVELRADGALFDVRQLAVPARGSATLVLDDLPFDPSVLEARMQSGDALAVDDVAWAARSQSSLRNVLLVTPGNLFLERALAGLPGVELTLASPGGALPDDSFDLIVHDGPITGTLPAGNLWVLGPFPTATASVFTNTAIIRAAVDDPILRYVDWEDTHILQAWSVEPPPGARTLVQAAGGPLLLVAERAEGRLAVLAFDLHQSDLPLRVAFPILTANLTAWLLPRGAAAAATSPPGQPVSLEPLVGAEEIVVVAPDGQRTSLLLGAAPPVYADTARPGVYQVAQLGPEGELLGSGLFTVNLFDELESDIGPRESIQIGQTEAAAAGPAEEGRHEVWPWLAGAALGVIALEWWVDHGEKVRAVGRRRRGA